MNSEKKIAFGFTKQIKKPNLQIIKPKEETKIQYIDCLEDKSIKTVEAEEPPKGPLVIPLRKVEAAQPKDVDENKKDVESNIIENIVPEKLSLDELAAQELLNDLKNDKESEITKILKLPKSLEKSEGEKESTLEDYESIPITDFGAAMLRGMGWEEGKGIGKKHSSTIISVSIPDLRPKGMGLGADKLVKQSNKNVSTNNDKEELKMIKGAFVKIIAGRSKDMYGEIVGFNDEEGRLFVKTVLKNTTLSINESLIQLVSKKEYEKNSRVLNVSKYEAYKSETTIKEERIEKKEDIKKYDKIKPMKSIVIESSEEESDYKGNRKQTVSSSKNLIKQEIDKYEKHGRDKYRNRNFESSDEEKYKKRSGSKKYRSRSNSREDRSYKSYKQKEKTDRYPKKYENESNDEDMYKKHKKDKYKKNDEKHSSKYKHKDNKKSSDSDSSDGERYSKHKSRDKKKSKKHSR